MHVELLGAIGGGGGLIIESRSAGKRTSRNCKLVEEAGRGCASWRNLGNQIFNADLFKTLALNHLRSIKVKGSGVKKSTHVAASIAYDDTVYAAYTAKISIRAGTTIKRVHACARTCVLAFMCL